MPRQKTEITTMVELVSRLEINNSGIFYLAKKPSKLAHSQYAYFCHEEVSLKIKVAEFFGRFDEKARMKKTKALKDSVTSLAIDKSLKQKLEKIVENEANKKSYYENAAAAYRYVAATLGSVMPTFFFHPTSSSGADNKTSEIKTVEDSSTIMKKRQ